MDTVRIDKYLWAIRAFKTRSEAADACNGGKVKIAGVNAKASKAVKPGDVIDVRKGAVQYSWRVLKLTESRMGAALVPDFAENLTPESELAKLQVPRESVVMSRDKGSGRPTKRDRRVLDELLAELEGL
ncbi:MAG: RNA-binding S4 domain-containing protein [Bacteroidales bacterium]|nr:RNA-binding S4 domain-containing protein [Bacteroidales bacterium]